MDLTQWQTWTEPFAGLWKGLEPLLPRICAALVLLLAGLLLAAGLRAVLRSLLQALGFDRRLAHLWLFQLWTRSHTDQTPSQGFANLSFYSVIFVAAMLAIRALGAGVEDVAFASLLEVVPRVLSVVLILLLGGLMAGFVSTLVQLAFAGSKLPHSVFWGKVAAWTTFGTAVMFSLEPLGLAGQLLTQAMLIGLGALALAVGLAFGLGCQDLAREFLKDLLREDKKIDAEP
ncbi:MAG: mechanosensitive ion channel family protein [bacterium]